MKKLIFPLLLLAVAFAFNSCEKDVVRPLVAINGNFTNTPVPEAGFFEFLMQDGSTFLFPQKYAVDGSCNLYGDVDETKSTLEFSNVSLDPVFMGFKGNCKIITVDSDGDELIHVGEFFTFMDFSNKSYLHFEGGTSKWKDADGWFNTTGQLDPVTGVNTLSGAGEVTEPK